MPKRYRLDTGTLCDRLAARVNMVYDKWGEWIHIDDHDEAISDLDALLDDARAERDNWIDEHDEQREYVLELERVQTENCNTIESLNEQIQELQNELKQHTSAG